MTVTPLHSIINVILAAFIGSFGAVFLKWGAARLHRDLRTLLFNWRLAIGIAMFLLSSYFFVLGVRDGELSVLCPMISFGYSWTLLWSRLFCGEPITRRKLAGLGMIFCGLILLYSGSR